MSSGTAVVDETTGGQSPDPQQPTRRLGGKWPLALAALLIIVGIAIAATWRIDVPYYTLSPGPVYDTSDFISVPDTSEGDVDGEMFFLTVALQEANVFQWAAAQVSPKVDLAPRQNIRPEGVSREELRRENLARMEQSKTDAAFVALIELGYEPTYIGTGALVINTIEGTGAEGILLPDDVIIAIDDGVVEFRDDVTGLVSEKEIGDTMVLTVERWSDDVEDIEVLDLTIVLGPHVDDPSLPMVGIMVDNNEPIVEFPVDIDIDSRNVGGPSAGLMFTLEIINQLTDDDITEGVRIAGTGTIRRDGTVGAIGGVRQKIYGAIDAGATVVFIPADNYDDALLAAGDSITVVRVDTIDDPLDFLGIDLAA